MFERIITTDYPRDSLQYAIFDIEEYLKTYYIITVVMPVCG
jgi:hypothetical protein